MMSRSPERWIKFGRTSTPSIEGVGSGKYTQFEIQGTILKGTALIFFKKIRDGNPEPFEAYRKN